MTSTAEEVLAPSTSALSVSRGSPLPLGATQIRNGINFAIFSRHATSVTLALFRPDQERPFREISFDARFNRTGDIWHAFIEGLDRGVRYGYRMDRGSNTKPVLHRYNPEIILLDPYAKATSGDASRGVILDDGFDWGADQPLNIPLSETIIYEVHVRGFTRDPSSHVRRPGTFAGLIEKIPYLKDLGITSVELLPVHEFEALDSDRVNPFTGAPLVNYWGYQPINFFAPNADYSSSKGSGDQVREFKKLVKALHQAGIEVILDVVFNHTAEGNERGRTFSYRGIDNAVYYMLDPQNGEYRNYSGCGNTLNCNHPVVRDLIVECLRYWVMDMHVDGFRFDLASVLGRGQDGGVLANPPLLEQLAYDPILANTKLIAEAWDAAGLYQVGTFPAWSRWAEWNGKFRDDVRRFVRGDPGLVSALATRLVGSPDLYRSSSREPYHSINFVTCHDGFTLADLVSYDHKHNEMNGEGNQDGTNENWSWNCGSEGPSSDPEIERFRRRQVRNMAAILLISDGVPMILAGDEFSRTQEGNNNAYCQDNEISWLDWTLGLRDPGLHRFFKLMIEFRRAHPLLRSTSYGSLAGEGNRRIEWHGTQLQQPDWSYESRSIALHLSGLCVAGTPKHVFFIANAHWEAHEFELPVIETGWSRFVDTTMESPADITETGLEQPLASNRSYPVGPRSTVILIGQV